MSRPPSPEPGRPARPPGEPRAVRIQLSPRDGGSRTTSPMPAARAPGGRATGALAMPVVTAPTPGARPTVEPRVDARATALSAPPSPRSPISPRSEAFDVGSDGATDLLPLGRMQESPVFMFTWNCGGRPPPDDEHSYVRSDLIESLVIRRIEEAKVVAIALQEVVELSAANAFLQAVSERGQREWIEFIDDCVLEATSRDGTPEGSPLARLETVSMFGLLLIVYISRRAARTVAFTSKGTVGGQGTMSAVFGNKGAVGIRFDFPRRSVAIVNVHLSAKTAKERRRDFQRVTAMEFVHSETGRRLKLKDHDAVIIMGDTNSRFLGIRNELAEWCVSQLGSEPGRQRLLKHDEIVAARVVREGRGHTLPGEVRHTVQREFFAEFDEGTVEFNPTYKYLLDAPRYDDGSAEGAKRRCPAWTDRILTRGTLRWSDGLYGAMPHVCWSDHRPVCATLSLLKPQGHAPRFLKLDHFMLGVQMACERKGAFSYPVRGLVHMFTWLSPKRNPVFLLVMLLFTMTMVSSVTGFWEDTWIVKAMKFVFFFSVYLDGDGEAFLLNKLHWLTIERGECAPDDAECRLAHSHNYLMVYYVTMLTWVVLCSVHRFALSVVMAPFSAASQRERFQTFARIETARAFNRGAKKHVCYMPRRGVFCNRFCLSLTLRAVQLQLSFISLCGLLIPHFLYITLGIAGFLDLAINVAYYVMTRVRSPDIAIVHEEEPRRAPLLGDTAIAFDRDAPRAAGGARATAASGRATVRHSQEAPVSVVGVLRVAVRIAETCPWESFKFGTVSTLMFMIPAVNLLAPGAVAIGAAFLAMDAENEVAKVIAPVSRGRTSVMAALTPDQHTLRVRSGWRSVRKLAMLLLVHTIVIGGPILLVQLALREAWEHAAENGHGHEHAGHADGGHADGNHDGGHQHAALAVARLLLRPAGAGAN